MTTSPTTTGSPTGTGSSSVDGPSGPCENAPGAGATASAHAADATTGGPAGTGGPATRAVRRPRLREPGVTGNDAVAVGTGRDTGSASAGRATYGSAAGSLVRSRWMATTTSPNGTWMGAFGLCTATSTACTTPDARTVAAMRSATVSIRSTGSPDRTAATCSASSP